MSQGGKALGRDNFFIPPKKGGTQLVKADNTKHIKALSYSAVSAYSECGMRWELSRLHGLDKSTWWVTLMGTAVHYVTEQHDLRRCNMPFEDVSFQTAFDREVAKAERFDMEIKASGRVLKTIGKSGGPDKKDRAWCEHYGPLMVKAWDEWMDARNLKPLVDPAGKPGIEVEVRGILGGASVVAYVDRVLVDGTGKIVVVDLKTGKVPSGTGQLDVYVALLAQRGFTVSRAAYWDAMDGDIPTWHEYEGAVNESGMGAWFGRAMRGMEAGVFVPNLGSQYCSSCPVRAYCVAAGGERASEVGESPKVTVARDLSGALSRPGRDADTSAKEAA